MKLWREKWADSALPLAILLILVVVTQLTSAQQGATCNALQPCKVGCCSATGHCGYGDEFCKDGCQGTCNATAECGQHALEDDFDCPLNVCCSEWGFCGFDSGFCNSKCQNTDKSQCNPVSRPTCSESTDAMSADVRIAYYGAWSAKRSCDAMQPETIPAGVLTHINVAFEFITADHEITDEVGHISGRVARLKNIYPGLRVNIAIGGWVFNDPPTQTRFSDTVSSVPNRHKFIKSLIGYMQKYALDGVDLDWEYPVADDRGGVPLDYSNFVLLCADIREAFDSYDPGWQLTLTLPASYWYLKGFDIKRLEKYVDWFNVMTYDIHGLWDQHNIWTGPFLKGHTNITEIEDGLDLLWRNDVSSKKVVMGFGFYGRGFTMEDMSCSTPPSCTFSGPGFAGDCTNEPGILSYNEVLNKEGELSSSVHYDEESSVKYMTFSGNQWVSYDDAQSFERKKKYMFSRCLKGLMIWELGLDTANNDALVGLFGAEAVEAGKRDTSLNPNERDKLALDLSAYTGQNCYVAPGCTNGIKGDSNSTCMAGYSSAETGHSLKQIQGDVLYAKICNEGEYHHICCPTKAMPKNCEWIGAPERSQFGCSGDCGASQFELTTDFSVDRYGKQQCGSGKRHLCCDSTEILRKCKWTSECDWSDSNNGNCKAGEKQVAKRYDKDDGDQCKVQKGMGNGGSQGPTTHINFRSYCCPEDDALEDCKWANDADYFKGKWDGRSWGCPNYPGKPADYCDKLGVCHAKDCYAGSLEVTSASITEASMEVSQSDSAWNLCGYDVALCCAPPSRFTKDWPVNPAYLWSEAFSDKKDDVTWEWANNFGNNHKDTKPDNLEEDPGEDPYGFVMLDGPPGSIAQQFSKQFTVLSETEATNVVSRSFVTTNRTILDSTFEHSDEELLVYCNYPHDSHHCKEIFYKGAADTIIKLPPHIGEGPWARVVSMEPEHAPGDLPTWAIRKRELAGVERNGIYRLKIDYSFNLIKRDDGPVNMRVDYTNLQNYWDEVTDEKPSKHRRSDDPFQNTMNFDSWKARVDKAKNISYATDHDEFNIAARGITTFEDSSVSSDKHLAKRWWGAFTAWLDKLNHITKDGDGFLPMGVKKMFNIYSGRLQCVNPSGVTLNAGLDITAEVNLQMGTRYAYYFSGTVVPPHIIDTYIFIGAQPSVYAGIDIRGNAELGYESEVKKLIATITYPGLSIKGIATVGPSLDILGQIAGKITVSGNLKVGAKYTMDPIEMYMPNTDESRNKASSKIKFDKDTGLQPVFQAGVRATLSAELRITPRINCGIRVGGSIGPRKQPLVEAQVAVYVNTSVYFEAYATAETQGLTSNWEYGYKVELRWRIGLDAVAQLYLYGEWRTKEYYPVDWQTIPIYGPIVVTSSNDDSMRVRGLDSKPFWELSSDPLPNTVFGKVYAVPVAHEPASADLPLMTYNSTSGKFAMPANHSKNSNYSRRAVDGEEKEFMLGSFKCTTSPNSVCDSTNDLETRGLDPFRPRDWHETHRELEGRDDDIARDCPGKVPRLYYNCAALFADMTLTGPAGSVTVPGICSSVRNYLRNHGIITNQYPLTYGTENRNTRQSQSCAAPRNPCSGTNGIDARYKASLGGQWPLVPHIATCDEFPFASTEEGGYGYVGTAAGLNPTNPLGTTRTCAHEPGQILQGNCNTLVGFIETDTEYFNTPGTPNPGHAAWYPWQGQGSGGWTSKNGMGGRQRLARYPVDQPVKLQGINAQERADRSLSWFHKRNFTLLLVSNPETGHAQGFPGNQFSSGTVQGQPITSQAWIMCAVSTRGQARFRFTRDYNGYCWDGQSTAPTFPRAGQGTMRVVYFSCKIDFVGATFPVHTKRRSVPIGFFDGMPVYGIEPAKDTETIVVDVPVANVMMPDSRQALPISYDV